MNIVGFMHITKIQQGTFFKLKVKYILSKVLKGGLYNEFQVKYSLGLYSRLFWDIGMQ